MSNKLLLRKSWLFSTFFLLPAIGITQFTQEWVARHNGPGNSTDATTSLAMDKEGNLYVTGPSAGAGPGSDYSTIKYNAAGVLQWEGRYNGPGNFDDIALSIAVDRKGNVYVTGWSQGITTGADFATIKYNSAGVVQWVARHNGPGNDFDVAKSIGVDGEGNVYITGESLAETEAGTTSVIETIKYNKDGIEQWVATYNGPGNTDAVNALTLDEVGNIYVVGNGPKDQDEDPNADFITIKYNKNGQELWVKRFNGPRDLYDEGLAVAVDESANVYATGRTAGVTEGSDYDYATVKYDANGNEQWAAFYNGPGNSLDIALALAVDASNNVYVTGQSAAEPQQANNDFATIKYDANGNEVWVSRHNGPADEHDEAVAMALDGQGNVYVTGRSTGVETGYDFATIKYNTAGVEQWVARYNGPGNDMDGPGFFGASHPIAVDGLGNVYVTGLSTGIESGFDFTTIKYAQPLPTCGKGDKVLICHKGKETQCIKTADALDHISHGDQLGECIGETARVVTDRSELSTRNTELPDRFRVSHAPNPVSTIAKIYYELPAEGNVTIKLFDMLGREIKTLVNAIRKAGYHNSEFDVSVLQKGFYIYRITLKTQEKVWVQTGKMSVVK